MEYLKNFFKSIQKTLNNKRIFFAGEAAGQTPGGKEAPKPTPEAMPAKETPEAKIARLKDEYSEHQVTFNTLKSGIKNEFINKAIATLTGHFDRLKGLFAELDGFKNQQGNLNKDALDKINKLTEAAEKIVITVENLLENANRLLKSKDKLSPQVYNSMVSLYSTLYSLRETFETNPGAQKIAENAVKLVKTAEEDTTRSEANTQAANNLDVQALQVQQELAKGGPQTTYTAERPKNATANGKIGQSNVEYYVIGNKVQLFQTIEGIDRNCTISAKDFEQFKNDPNPDKRFCEILTLKNTKNGSLADIYKYFPKKLSAEAIRKSNDTMLTMAYGADKTKVEETQVAQARENSLRKAVSKRGVLGILKEKEVIPRVITPAQAELETLPAEPALVPEAPIGPAPTPAATVPPAPETSPVPKVVVNEPAPAAPAASPEVTAKKQALIKEITKAAMNNPQFVDSMVKTMLEDEAATNEVINILKDDPNFVEAIVSIAKQDKKYESITTGTKWEVFKSLSHKGRFFALFQGREDALKTVLGEAVKKPALMDKLVQIGAKHNMINDVVKTLKPEQIDSVFAIIKTKPELLKTVIQNVPDIIKTNPELTKKIMEFIPQEKQMQIAENLMQTNPKIGNKIIGKMLGNPTLSQQLFKNEAFMAKMQEIAMQNPEIKAKVQQETLSQKFGAAGTILGAFGNLAKVVPGIGDNVQQLENQMMNDPKIQAMAIESVKSNPNLQKEIFESLSPDEKSGILDMAFKDPSFDAIKKQAMEEILKDPNMTSQIITALPPQVINEIAQQILA